MGKHISLTPRNFNIGRKQLFNQVNEEQKIRKQTPKSPACHFGQVRYPLMEKKLYTKFRKMRKKRKSIKNGS